MPQKSISSGHLLSRIFFHSRKRERHALGLYIRSRRSNGRNLWNHLTVRFLPVTYDLVKAFKRCNLSEPSSVISDDDRQNNLLEKAKGKIYPLFYPILIKACHQ